MAQQVVIVGLGRFGTVLARALTESGYDVLAVDRQPEPVRELADVIGKAVQGDATSLSLWNDLPVKGADFAVIAFSSNVEANVLAALVLKKLGIHQVIAKSESELHTELLRAIGADAIVEPAKESALRLAHTLGTRIQDYLEVTRDFGVAKVAVSNRLKGITVRKLYDDQGVGVLLLRRGDRVVLEPRDDEQMREGDILILAGKDEDLRKLPGVGYEK